MLSKTLLALLLAKAATALPTGQASNANQNMPMDLAKHYVPSNVMTNTLKFPLMGAHGYCESESSTTLMSIDGVLVPLMADAGWYTVTYGSQYTYADQIFVLQNKKTSILQLTGCFCSGNQFQVFDNGVPVTLTDNCDLTTLDNPNCDERTTVPEDCATNAIFCNGVALLEPGWHNISVGVLLSPWGAGAAYIRVDTAAQGATSYLNLPLTPLCMMNGNNCNQQIIE